MRTLSEGDIPALRELDALAFSADEQYDGEFYGETIGTGGFEAIGIVNRSGSIVAWVLVDATRHTVRIRSLAVHPSFRRRGLASDLITGVLEKHRAKPVDLLVDQHNAAAVALYRRFDFADADPDPQMPERLRMVRRG
ncbi:MAG TPA: GNAT family N-acetyltransferase [Candidatus Baltobacteraceae bacterium]|nr:GNAT family N-acetyltransferase [Candidatus Baltobacteraceae bacterium]